MNILNVLVPGPFTTVQDLGRTGYGHLGVPPSGALDQVALRRANRLLGNPEDMAGLEILHGGFEASVQGPAWIVVCGAWGLVTADGRRIEPNRPARLGGGERLVVGPAQYGMRSYLAVRGGVHTERVLGSRSYDMLSGLGPPPLRGGDRIPIGPPPATPLPFVDIAPWDPPTAACVQIPVRLGPHRDWFTAETVRQLLSARWALSPDSSRTGARLMGEPLQRQAGELPSEGMVTGAIQVPPSGLPVILLTDHPVTGGYPVIAVVATAALSQLAQLRPGQTLQLNT